LGNYSKIFAAVTTTVTFQVDLASESTVVLVSSTTGDGEQPEKAEPFWRRIRRKKLASNHLSHLSFTILGLGDSNYSQFCNGPKTLYKRMLELGAKTFYDPGWADDGVG
jgi:methionine synthase reductase